MKGPQGEPGYSGEALIGTYKRINIFIFLSLSIRFNIFHKKGPPGPPGESIVGPQGPPGKNSNNFIYLFNYS